MGFRTVLRLTLIALVLLPRPVQAAPAVTAEAAILVDRDTGQVIWAKNPDRRMNPASLTKIMTGLLAVEEGRPADVVTVSKHAALVGEGQVIGLHQGDRLTLLDLMRAALIYSANDSTVAIGEHIAGTEPLFLELMNAKAAILGAGRTRYANTNGYTDPNHYTTARDLAVITRFALTRPLFAEVVRTPAAVLHWIGTSRQMEISTTNRLLNGYPGLHGVKTGTTGAAGKCVVVAATRDGIRLIAVVLKSGDRWADAARMLDTGFLDTENVPVGDAGTVVATVAVSAGRERSVPVALGRDVFLRLIPADLPDLRRRINLPAGVPAPVRAGTVVGEVVYTLRGGEVARYPLVASLTVEKQNFWQRMTAR
ncbi:MAG: D-alanyl-D-alanine carboxypeptidase [Peptococcaceae bacterium]|nr:D-alanyl-D-alanine carboxypeptidase [Peptococcaceae bacterium]